MLIVHQIKTFEIPHIYPVYLHNYSNYVFCLFRDHWNVLEMVVVERW